MSDNISALKRPPSTPSPGIESTEGQEQSPSPTKKAKTGLDLDCNIVGPRPACDAAMSAHNGSMIWEEIEQRHIRAEAERRLEECRARDARHRANAALAMVESMAGKEENVHVSEQLIQQTESPVDNSDNEVGTAISAMDLSSSPGKAKDHTASPPLKYAALSKAHDFRSMTLLQFTDCPNLMALLLQRQTNHVNRRVTQEAIIKFDAVWDKVWEVIKEEDMSKLTELDNTANSHFRKLVDEAMNEYQNA